jgi:hypothetical protein
MTHTPCAKILSCLLVLGLLPIYAEERVDLGVIHKIREEALQNSKVMDHVFQLTDVHGPRLTNSPGFFGAADWVVKQLKEWGIEGHQEKWGPFGQGWTYTHFSANLIEPQYAPLIGFPLAYSPGTNGPVTGDVTIAVLNAEPDFEKYKGKLRGKIVLVGTGRDIQMSLQPLAVRRTDDELGSQCCCRRRRTRWRSGDDGLPRLRIRRRRRPDAEVRVVRPVLSRARRRPRSSLRIG